MLRHLVSRDKVILLYKTEKYRESICRNSSLQTVWVMRGYEFGARRPGFEFWFCYLLAV